VGLDDDDDEEQMTIVSGEESIIPIVPDAEPVNTEEEERRWKNDFIATAPIADVVPDVIPVNRGKRRKLVGAFSLLIAVVLGAVLGIMLRPETRSQMGYGVLLSSVSSDGGEALTNSSTPQSMAFNWVVTNTARSRSDEQIIQRYALATLFYSTNGYNWTEKKFWLDDGDECDRWKTDLYYGGGSVTCTAANEVSELDLSENNLQGTLPPEIGLLSKLGEFIVEESCQDALAHSLWASIRIHLVILIDCLDCLCSYSICLEQCTRWYDSI
jgi:hypothetical protein